MIGKEKILYFCIFMLFVLSMKIWIGWNGMDRWFYIIILSILVFLHTRKKIRVQYSKRDAIALVCLYLGMVYINGRPFGFTTILTTALFAYILFIKDLDKAKCLRYISKWYAYLMAVSLIIFWLVQIWDIPPLGLMIYENEELLARNPDYCIRLNYLFYLPFMREEAIRFNGPFLEPGHLGMMAAFLLFCNRFDFSKKYNIVNLIALFHTFSLAGYLLFLIGFLMIRYYEGKMKFYRMFIYLILFLSVIQLAYTYNSGNNYLKTLILDRLELDEERGFIGNNRTSTTIIEYEEEMWEGDNTRLLMQGYSEQEWNSILDENRGFKGTGYIVSLVHYGMFGILAMLLFYFIYFIYSKNKKFALISFVFLLAMFWQRTYPFWFCWIICYSYGIASAEYLKVEKK